MSLRSRIAGWACPHCGGDPGYAATRYGANNALPDEPFPLRCKTCGKDFAAATRTAAERRPGERRAIMIVVPALAVALGGPVLLPGSADLRSVIMLGLVLFVLFWADPLWWRDRARLQRSLLASRARGRRQS